MDIMKFLYPGKMKNILFGKDAKLQRYKALTGYQKDYLRDLFSQLSDQPLDLASSPLYQQGSDYLSNLLSGSPESTAAFEAPAMRQFNEQIMPGIAEQFAGVGGLSSSGFQNSAAGAGASLAERLQALRSGLQFQGAGQALGYSQAPFSQRLGLAGLGLGTPAFGYTGMPGQQGLIGGAAPGMGQAFAMKAMMGGM